MAPHDSEHEELRESHRVPCDVKTPHNLLFLHIHNSVLQGGHQDQSSHRLQHGEEDGDCADVEAEVKEEDGRPDYFNVIPRDSDIEAKQGIC